jgi:hypothetical protein
MKGVDTHRWVGVAAMWLLAAALSAAPARSGGADDANSPATGTAQQAPEKPAASASEAFPAQPPSVDKRGFFNDVGTWWNQSVANFGATMKAAKDKLEDINKKQNDTAKDVAKDAATATQDALKDAAQATKDAATAVVRLPNTRVLELHDRCALAANGAPDCAAAATSACRQKGFNSGQPIDVRTSQECPATVVLSGRTPGEGECPDETVVLRAICQ